MTSNASLLTAAILLVVLLAVYGYIAVSGYEPEQAMQPVGIANPAAQHCVGLGGTIEIQRDETGAEAGFCALPDGRTCEEWALMRENICIEIE